MTVIGNNANIYAIAIPANIRAIAIHAHIYAIAIHVNIHASSIHANNLCLAKNSSLVESLIESVQLTEKSDVNL